MDIFTSKKVDKKHIIKNPYVFRFYYINGGRTFKTETVGQRIVRFCMDHQLTLAEFAKTVDYHAKAFGVTVSYANLWQYINYRISPKLDKLTAIAATMGVSVDWLTGYEGPYQHSANISINARDFCRMRGAA